MEIKFEHESIIISEHRRHIFEIVEELADAVWWTLLLVPGGIALAEVAAWPFAIAASVMLAAVPWMVFAWELAKWRNETYVITRGENGQHRLAKRSGVLAVRESRDEVSRLFVEASASAFERLIGVERVRLSGPAHEYITGRRMPKAFRRELERCQDSAGALPKAPSAPAGGVMEQVEALERLARFLPREAVGARAFELMMGGR